jgi:hypothetical protein
MVKGFFASGIRTFNLFRCKQNVFQLHHRGKILKIVVIHHNFILKECMYLHEVADEKISFTKEDMHQGKHTEYERRLLEHMFALFGIQGPTGFNQQQQQTSTGGKEMIARNRARVTIGEQM